MEDPGVAPLTRATLATSITSERINDTGSNFVSSDDFVDCGPSVIDGQTRAKKAVFSEADLHSSDIVEVAGIPITVAQAKAAGVNITANATADTAREAVAQAPGNDIDREEVDTRGNDDGLATDAELVAMDNVASAVELHTELDREATLELGKDILTGQIPEGDPVWNGLRSKGISQEAAIASVSNVVRVGQAAAMRELGQAEYQELSRLADGSTAIKDMVINHGIKRMTGK